MNTSTEQFEQQVRAMLHRHAADAPTHVASGITPADLPRRDHGARIASIAAGLCVAAVVGVTAVFGLHHPTTGHRPAAGGVSVAPVTPSSLPFVLPPGRTLNSLPAHVVPSTGFDQVRLDAIAGRLESAGIARFASSYSGVALDEAHDRVLCYRTPSSAFDRYVGADFRGEPVVMIDALFTRAQTNTTVDRITHDESYWQANGVHLASWGPSPVGSGVFVMILEHTNPTLAGAFNRRYAPVLIQLTTGRAPVPLSGSSNLSGTTAGK